MDSTEDAATYMDTLAATTGGEFVKVDHTFQAATYIRTPTGEQAVSAVLTLMNEHNQVVAQFFTQTKGLKEVEQQLEQVKLNYQALQQEVCVVSSICNVGNKHFVFHVSLNIIPHKLNK